MIGEHTQEGSLTHKTRMFECLCGKERSIGKSETLPKHKINEYIKGRITHDIWIMQVLRKQCVLDYKAKVPFIKLDFQITMGFLYKRNSS